MRTDISDSLIHFTKENGGLSAYEILKNILKERILRGSGNLIRGGSKCVCFSEVPVHCVEGGFLNSKGSTRYSRFGLIFQKDWVFRLGGRPVIYQTEEEFETLPESIRWRHVKLDLRGEHNIDFTWEREWRIKSDSVGFANTDVSVLLPNKDWENRFIEEMELDSYYEALSWTVVLGDLAMLYNDGNPWKTITTH